MLNKKTNVGIIGLGFVGSAMLVAVSNARFKGKSIFNTIGIDRDNVNGNKIIKSINLGKFPYLSKDKTLSRSLHKSVKLKNARATNRIQEIASCDIIIVDINLDIKHKKGIYDVNFKNFINCIKNIGLHAPKNFLLILESTVPVGTTEKIVLPIIKKEFSKRNLSNNFSIAHSYERVMPGKNYLKSITDFWRVYSGIDKKSKNLCKNFYSKIINVNKFPLTELINTRDSEYAKLLENSYRALNIAFIDEQTKFADKININLNSVIKAIKIRKTHNNIMKPGIGVGGYCLTKDPAFIEYSAFNLYNLKKLSFPLISKIIPINNNSPSYIEDIIKNYLPSVKNLKVAILGASYKADVGDTRSSPSEKIYKKIKYISDFIDVYDPIVKYWSEINISPEPLIKNLKKYDIVIIAVNHDYFKKINLTNLVSSKCLIIDTVDLINKFKFKKQKLKCKLYKLGEGFAI
jgi:UDP-N-acetyl-D-glucosamine dehydrogenase